MTRAALSVAVVLGVLALPTARAAAQMSVDVTTWLTPTEERLAFAVAKVSYNEAADSMADLQLVWAITEGHSSTTRGRLRWLQCHSPRVLGRPGCRQIKFCREDRNCWWTRNLTRDGAQPEGWPYSDRWWRHVVRRRWLVHLERAKFIVSGYKAHNPCKNLVPYSWGSEQDIPRKQAAGWSFYRCGDATNYGFSRPLR